MKQAILFISAIVFLAGCTPEPSKFTPVVQELVFQEQFSSARAENHQEVATKIYSNYKRADLEKALRVASQLLVGRDPSNGEMRELSAGIQGYEKVLVAMMSTPQFRDKQLEYYRGFFAQGNPMNLTQGIDYNEPANLATYLIVNDRDFREVLTADYCVKYAAPAATSTDPKAGFTTEECSIWATITDVNERARVKARESAGAITTRAFMEGKQTAHYGFSRVNWMSQFFACNEMPDGSDAGLEVAEVASTEATFSCTGAPGSGCESNACYSCHRNLNSRAAVFLRYDRLGQYNLNPPANRALLRVQEMVPGTNQPNITRFSDLQNSGAFPRYHGRPITSVREYAMLMTRNKSFRNCLAQRLTNWMVARKALGNTTRDFLPEFSEIRDDVSSNGFDIKKIILQIAKHPAFVLRE